MALDEARGVWADNVDVAKDEVIDYQTQRKPGVFETRDELRAYNDPNPIRWLIIADTETEYVYKAAETGADDGDNIIVDALNRRYTKHSSVDVGEPLFEHVTVGDVANYDVAARDDMQRLSLSRGNIRINLPALVNASSRYVICIANDTDSELSGISIAAASGQTNANSIVGTASFALNPGKTQFVISRGFRWFTAFNNDVFMSLGGFAEFLNQVLTPGSLLEAVYDPATSTYRLNAKQGVSDLVYLEYVQGTTLLPERRYGVTQASLNQNGFALPSAPDGARIEFVNIDTPSVEMTFTPPTGEMIVASNGTEHQSLGLGLVPPNRTVIANRVAGQWDVRHKAEGFASKSVLYQELLSIIQGVMADDDAKTLTFAAAVPQWTLGDAYAEGAVIATTTGRSTYLWRALSDIADSQENPASSLDWEFAGGDGVRAWNPGEAFKAGTIVWVDEQDASLWRATKDIQNSTGSPKIDGENWEPVGGVREFISGQDYKINEVVWVSDGSQTLTYRCVNAILNTQTAPDQDPANWEPVGSASGRFSPTVNNIGPVVQDVLIPGPGVTLIEEGNRVRIQLTLSADFLGDLAIELSNLRNLTNIIDITETRPTVRNARITAFNSTDTTSTREILQIGWNVSDFEAGDQLRLFLMPPTATRYQMGANDHVPIFDGTIKDFNDAVTVDLAGSGTGGRVTLADFLVSGASWVVGTFTWRAERHTIRLGKTSDGTMYAITQIANPGTTGTGVVVLVSSIGSSLDTYSLKDLSLLRVAPWAAATDYVVGDLRRNGNTLYLCILNHTSGSSFSTGANWVAAEGSSNAAEWAATTVYAIGDLVRNGSKVYMAIRGHTSGNTFPSGNTLTTNWVDLTTSAASFVVPAWTANSAYAEGDLVRNSGNLYMSTGSHTSGARFAVGSNWTLIGPAVGGLGAASFPVWRANTAYSIGQGIRQGNKAYMAISAHTSGANFPTGNTLTNNWVDLTASGGDTGTFRGEWATGVSYQVGHVVWRETQIYRCIIANSDATFTGSKWTELSPQIDISGKADTTVVDAIDARVTTNEANITANNSAIALKADDDDLTAAEARISSLEDAVEAPAWAATTSYKAGDLVWENGRLYRASSDHTSGVSFDETNWDEVGIRIALWVTGTSYRIGDVVINDDRLFRCHVAIANSTTEPHDDVNSTNWTEIGGGATGSGITTWTFGNSYQTNDIVISRDRLYRATANVANATTRPENDATNWTEIGAVNATGAVNFSVEELTLDYDTTETITTVGGIRTLSRDIEFSPRQTVGRVGSGYDLDSQHDLVFTDIAASGNFVAPSGSITYSTTPNGPLQTVSFTSTQMETVARWNSTQVGRGFFVVFPPTAQVTIVLNKINSTTARWQIQSGRSGNIDNNIYVSAFDISLGYPALTGMVTVNLDFSNLVEIDETLPTSGNAQLNLEYIHDGDILAEMTFYESEMRAKAAVTTRTAVSALTAANSKKKHFRFGTNDFVLALARTSSNGYQVGIEGWTNTLLPSPTFHLEKLTGMALGLRGADGEDGDPGITVYQTGADYAVNDIVLSNNALYRCIATVLNSAERPEADTDNTNWTPLGPQLQGNIDVSDKLPTTYVHKTITTNGNPTRTTVSIPDGNLQNANDTRTGTLTIASSVAGSQNVNIVPNMNLNGVEYAFDIFTRTVSQLRALSTTTKTSMTLHQIIGSHTDFVAIQLSIIRLTATTWSLSLDLLTGGSALIVKDSSFDVYRGAASDVTLTRTNWGILQILGPTIPAGAGAWDFKFKHGNNIIVQQKLYFSELRALTTKSATESVDFLDSDDSLQYDAFVTTPTMAVDSGRQYALTLFVTRNSSNQVMAAITPFNTDGDAQPATEDFSKPEFEFRTVTIT